MSGVAPSRGDVAGTTRRIFLQRTGWAALSSLCGGVASALRSGTGTRLTAADDEFLDDLSRRAFRYFWEQQNLETGLVLDRARTDGEPDTTHGPPAASIAATGFGLTALAIAAERGWVSAAEARARVLTTLRFFADRARQEHGWFYHFLHPQTGERQWNCEISSVDTAWLLAGVLTARQKFGAPDEHAEPGSERGGGPGAEPNGGPGGEIARLAARIYERIDFHWMLNGNPYLLDDGWTPEKGFLTQRWKSYSELMLLYLLAMGSPAGALPVEAWYAWRRPEISYAGLTFVRCKYGALFVHQYSHAWVDFRHRRDRRAPHYDYFLNSVNATRAQRAFCLSLARRFPGYSDNVWGITSSDSPGGYIEWGGPPDDPAIDGTVAPAAAGGSLMFTPGICLAALRTMRHKFGDRIYGRYGFTDAFNPTTGWVDPDVVGIGLGITLLSAENLRTGNVWRWFMKNPEPERAVNMVLEPYPGAAAD